jgi:importin subunit alpha-1
MVVDAGAVPNLVTLLSSPSAEIRDQAAWCLGNIAGVCPALRDGALTAGALGPSFRK